MVKLSDDEAKEMLSKLAQHFGEPVMPVGRYCAALNLWASALRMKAERLNTPWVCDGTCSGDELGDCNHASRTTEAMDQTKRDADHATKFADEVGGVFMQISKSNLLARLIYEGESLRTEMCPVHNGVWSGCGWAEKDENNCKCQHSQDGHIGSNITGWLP